MADSEQAHEAPAPNLSRRPVSGRRATFVLVSGLLCMPAVLTSAVMAGAVFKAESPSYGLMGVPILAWSCLAWMSAAWLRDHRLPRIVPVLGTMLGLGAAVPLLGALPFFIWGLPLAFRVVAFHLALDKPSD